MMPLEPEPIPCPHQKPPTSDLWPLDLAQWWGGGEEAEGRDWGSLPNSQGRQLPEGSRWGLTPPGPGIENCEVATAKHEHKWGPRDCAGLCPAPSPPS